MNLCSQCNVTRTSRAMCDDCAATHKEDGLALVAFCVVSFFVVVLALGLRVWMS